MTKKSSADRPAPGQVMPLAELADYQDGCVVSRTLAKTEHGSVTVFAFDRDQSLSEHTVSFDAMIHVLDGEAEIKISGTPHLLKQGEMIVMPADAPHAVRAPERFKMVLIILR